MKYKEFEKWVITKIKNKNLGKTEALNCLFISIEVLGHPVLEREKIWHERYEEYVVNKIIRE